MSKFLDWKWMVDWGFEEAPKTAKLGGTTVGDLNLPEPPTLPSNASCHEALDFMQAHHTQVVPAISADKGLVGIVTDEGLMNYLASEKAAASDPLSQAFAAEFREISPDTSLDQLRFILIKEGTAFVTKVVEGKKHLVAVVTKKDLLQHLAKAK